MKKLTLIAILSAFSFAGFAQDKASDKLSFSAGLEAAMPFGDFADVNKFGIGASVQGAYQVASKAAITLNAGYVTYSGKTIETSAAGLTNKTEYGALNVIPVMAGLKYSLADKIYAHGQAGMSFWNTEIKSTTTVPVVGTTTATVKSDDSDFTWSIGVGYNITSNIDVLLKFNSINSSKALNAIGLRVAYNF